MKAINDYFEHLFKSLLAVTQKDVAFFWDRIEELEENLQDAHDEIVRLKKLAKKDTK